jgi:DNA-binding CsgD family transcriptional regulator
MSDFAGITVSSDYERRAQQHRPQTKADMAQAVKQLLAQGLTPRDVSTLLGLSIADVVSLQRLAS